MAMTRRERLTAAIRGKAVDRPPVSFYEIGGFRIDPEDPDPFNVYNAPDWRPLLELAEDETDLIRMRRPRLTPAAGNPLDEFIRNERWFDGDSRFDRTTVTVAGRTLTRLARRDAGLDTTWTVEHLLKDTDDLKAYLELPDDIFDFETDVEALIEEDEALGDRGIVMPDTSDPLCVAAEMFPMGEYTIVALTEPELFHRLLEKLAGPMLDRTRRAAEAFPGRLWRICGPEFATEPYLPPRLFEEYVVRYTGPMVRAILDSGGYPRIHCHGRIKAVLPHIVRMGATATDPIEPPPQGDVELAYVRREYGRELTLFGNIEVTDIENLPPEPFERVVAASLRDGTAGEGRGFVLMPTASPYGRTINERTLTNYRTIVRLAKGFRP